MILELLRVHQYIKNLFVFAPVIFSLSLTANNIISTIFVFLLFSILASSVYIFNDIMDIATDKLHPVKSKRPIAKGLISIKSAIFMFLLLAITSLSLALWMTYELFAVLCIYLLLNILYSIKLKHIAIIDIFIIAIGFVLRIFAGNSFIKIDLSTWIITMTFLLAVFLGIAKRRDDLLLANKNIKSRKNIEGYSLEFINATMVLMASVIIVSYILYTVSPTSIARFESDNLYLTAIFVIFGILRYMQITFVYNNSGNPSQIVLTDMPLQATIVIWLISFLSIATLS